MCLIANGKLDDDCTNRCIQRGLKGNYCKHNWWSNCYFYLVQKNYCCEINIIISRSNIKNGYHIIIPIIVSLNYMITYSSMNRIRYAIRCINSARLIKNPLYLITACEQDKSHELKCIFKKIVIHEDCYVLDFFFFFFFNLKNKKKKKIKQK